MGVAVWVVRGGDSNELAAQIKQKNYVAVGFAAVPDVSTMSSRLEILEAVREFAPGGGTTGDSQLYRFAKEIQQGDYILTPEWSTKVVHVGRCTGAYRRDASIYGESYPHVRPVEYLRAVPRKQFSQTVRNTLGSVLTVFRADNALPFIDESGGPTSSDPPLTGDAWAEEIDAQARGQILQALDDIEHHDFQTFVAGVLHALKYRTQVGKKGKDGGVDIVAFPDAFGLAAPRIKCQTKNQKTAAGIQDVGYLNGVLDAGEKGLFVCTGGFTKDAESASFVRNGQVALVDGLHLLDLIVEHYEDFPDGAKQLLPLRRIYVSERPSTD